MVSAQREEGDLSRLGSDTSEEENSKVYVTLVYLGKLFSIKVTGPSFGKYLFEQFVWAIHLISSNG